MPRPMTISQCQRDQGSRSSRAGIRRGDRLGRGHRRLADGSANSGNDIVAPFSHGPAGRRQGTSGARHPGSTPPPSACIAFRCTVAGIRCGGLSESHRAVVVARGWISWCVRARVGAHIAGSASPWTEAIDRTWAPAASSRCVDATAHQHPQQGAIQREEHRREPEPDPRAARRRGAVRGAQAEPGRRLQEDRRRRSGCRASGRARCRPASSTSASAAARCSRRRQRGAAARLRRGRPRARAAARSASPTSTSPTLDDGDVAAASPPRSTSGPRSTLPELDGIAVTVDDVDGHRRRRRRAARRRCASASAR